MGRPIRNLDKPKNQLGHNIFQRKRVLFIFPIYQKPTNKQTKKTTNSTIFKILIHVVMGDGCVVIYACGEKKGLGGEVGGGGGLPIYQ